ncbi:GGDEF domain-containing protein [candidate division WOR-3 bacterium]|nr:GGDEF domain-containing protein [candidate division WOR-3 bacterium]
MDENVISRLLANKFFRGIEKKDIKRIPSDYFVLKDFKPNEIIIQENSKAGNLYLILQGSVKITKSMLDKEEIHLAHRDEGEIFGELGVLGDDKITSANVYAVKDSQIAILKPDYLSKIFEALPKTYSNIVEDIINKLKRSDGVSVMTLGYLKNIKELNKRLEGAKQELEKKNKDLVDINEKIEHLNSELQKKNSELYRTSITDRLTGIHNRAFVMDTLEKEFSKAKRHNLHFSCVMVDIDDFKKCNDTYGHLVGDEVLKRVAGIIFDNIRKEDTVGRFGGEEFLILFPSTEEKSAKVIAEKIREKIKDIEFSVGKIKFMKTISLGVAELSNSKGIKNEDELLFFADKAMYEAKRQGKNRTVLFSEIN